MDAVFDLLNTILAPIFDITTDLIAPILDQLNAIGLPENVVQFMLIASILGLSIYFTLYCGMFSLANAGFMAIGAYIGAIMTAHHDYSLGEALFWSMLVAGIIAVPIGLPMLRLKNIYLAIATIGFGEVVRLIIQNFDKLAVELRDSSTFGSMVRPILEALVEDVDERRLRITYGPAGITRIPRYTETAHLVIFLLVVSYFLFRFHRSRMGRAMAAIRQDEKVAASQGINVVYYKNVAFVIGAALAAAAGTFSAASVGTIVPDDYDFNRAVDILAYAVLGGLGSWVGPIIGGFTLRGLPEVLRELAEYTGFINGLALLLIIIYLPGGITSLLRPKFWTQGGRFPMAKRLAVAGLVIMTISNVLPYVNVASTEGRRLGYEAWGDAFGKLIIFGFELTALVYMNVLVWVAYRYVSRIRPLPMGGSFSRPLSGLIGIYLTAFVGFGLLGTFENVTTGYYVHVFGMVLVVVSGLISYPAEAQAPHVLPEDEDSSDGGAA